MKRKLLFLLMSLWCTWLSTHTFAQARQSVTVNLNQATAEQVLNPLRGADI